MSGLLSIVRVKRPQLTEWMATGGKRIPSLEEGTYSTQKHEKGQQSRWPSSAMTSGYGNRLYSSRGHGQPSQPSHMEEHLNRLPHENLFD